MLHKTRVPLRTWLWAEFFVARRGQGIFALQLKRDSGPGSCKTAWLLLHKLRAVLGPDPSGLLAGFVEADETYLGAPHEKGRGGGRGRHTRLLLFLRYVWDVDHQAHLLAVDHHLMHDVSLTMIRIGRSLQTPFDF